MKGRSKCLTCGKTLHWYETIPLFSYLFLGGKCLGCNAKISAQYPLVEFVTGALFCGVFFVEGFSSLLPVYFFVTCLLVIMAFYDFKHQIIPNAMVFLFDALAFLILIYTHGFSNLFSGAGLYDFLAGPILFSFFAVLFFGSGGRAMGFGDAKLALGVGWLLGFSGGIFAIIMAFWIGAAWSLLIIALEKLHLSKLKLGMRSEIPFAPFIIIGIYLQLFTMWNFLTIINWLTFK